jgi:MOSC domain-containing protein YiiM
LKHIAQQTGGVFGVYAKVVSGGTVCRGDEALL